jgi:hypothetical protein
MRHLLAIPLFLFFYSSSSQGIIEKDLLAPQTSEERKEPPVEILFCGIGPDAHPANPEKWKEFLISNLALDDASLDTICAGTYRVMVQFVVKSSGQLDDIKIIMDPGYGLGERVKNVLSRYKERWKPAVFNGRPSISYHKMPIVFMVEEEEEEKCNEPLPAGVTP